VKRRPDHGHLRHQRCWTRNQLNHKTLVATVMSNMGLDIALRRAGGSVIKTAVGDRYVVEEMRKSGYNLGGRTIRTPDLS